MKPRKTPMLFEVIGDIPSEYITEAAEEKDTKTYAPKPLKKSRWIALIAASLALLLILPSALVIGHFRDPLVRYRNHPYYAVLSSLFEGENEAAFIENMRRGNLFDQLSSLFPAGAKADESVNATGKPESDVNFDDKTESATPDDVTDNQVEGVLEADVVKRSRTHIYYLWNNTLFIYTLEGAESRRVAELSVVFAHGNTEESTNYTNFYLLDDKIILEGLYLTEGRGYTRLVTLSQADLLDGEINESPAVATLEGGLLSTRLVGSHLLVMTSFAHYDAIDVDDENYLPHYKTADGFVALSPDKITMPDTPSDIRCTVAYLLDNTTLAVKDAHALYGVPSAQYVSDNTLYLVSSNTKLLTKEPTVNPYNQDRTCLISKTTSYIEAIGYSDNGFNLRGGVTVDGEVKDQYSLDEYQNTLRVAVTTTDEIHSLNARESRINGTIRETNASLYVISLDTFTILSSANKFAPKNETVQSVRFDEALAYVCTAEVRTMTDPVYRFDLTDPSRITSLDTGTIDGYSTSLVELANGDLLGIGYGDTRDIFKLEIYRKVENTLSAVASYEIDYAEFSENYKSYYINREENLFGIPIYIRASEYEGVTVYENDMRYLLFSYDGEVLSVKETVSIGNFYYIETTRGFVHNNTLYVVCPTNLFVAPLSN